MLLDEKALTTMSTKTVSRRIGILALAFLGFLAGCGMVTVMESPRYIGAPIYAPTVIEEVKILRSPPVGRYELIGEIRLKAKGTPSKTQIFFRLKWAASNMGANAVVLVADKAGLTGGTVADPQWWNGELKKGEDRVIVGVAIWHPQ